VSVAAAERLGAVCGAVAALWRCSAILPRASPGGSDRGTLIARGRQGSGRGTHLGPFRFGIDTLVVGWGAGLTMPTRLTFLVGRSYPSTAFDSQFMPAENISRNIQFPCHRLTFFSTGALHCPTH
jgi:hypothetical protein